MNKNQQQKTGTLYKEMIKNKFEYIKIGGWQNFILHWVNILCNYRFNPLL